MAIALLGLQSHDLVNGLANYKLLKGLGLGVPLSANGADRSHAVVGALLHLGGVLVAGGDKAVGHVHLVLGHIQAAGDDLAVGVGNDGGEGGINLSIAGSGAVEVGDNAHAQGVSGLSAGILGGSLGVLSGSLGSGVLSGSLGSGILSGSLGAAAGDKCKYHAQQENQTDNLFHCSSLSHFKFFYTQRMLHISFPAAALCPGASAVRPAPAKIGLS